MYELAYHINSNLEEAEVKNLIQQVEALVTQNGGTVSSSREAKKVHLSYPIDHQHFAFMCVMDFSGPAEMLEGINDQLKLQEGILRFLIIRKPEVKELRTFGEQRMRKVRTHTAPTTHPLQTKKEATPGEEKE